MLVFSPDPRRAYTPPEGRNREGEAVRGNACMRKSKAFPQLLGGQGNRLQGVGSLLPEMIPGSV